MDDLQRLIELIETASRINANVYIQKEDIPLVLEALIALKEFPDKQLFRSGRVAVGHYTLNKMNGEGKLDYADYSHLFDLFTRCE